MQEDSVHLLSKTQELGGMPWWTQESEDLRSIPWIAWEPGASIGMQGDGGSWYSVYTSYLRPFPSVILSGAWDTDREYLKSLRPLSSAIVEAAGGAESVERTWWWKYNTIGYLPNISVQDAQKHQFWQLFNCGLVSSLSISGPWLFWYILRIWNWWPLMLWEGIRKSETSYHLRLLTICYLQVDDLSPLIKLHNLEELYCRCMFLD